MHLNLTLHSVISLQILVYLPLQIREIILNKYLNVKMHKASRKGALFGNISE